eukprot:GFUD01081030.1.p1 GENE.GFUD01081030.1~~GFUD01081030.1.p1  ORF type:complete len:379 (-),score=73.03 GFUD01081030.1:141-1277(-)
MDDTIVFLLFWLLQSSYKLLNIILRLTFNRCFMFGQTDAGRTRSLKVKIIGRAKSRGASAVHEVPGLDNFIFYFDSQVEDIETEINKPEVSLYGFTTEFAFFSVVSPGQSVWDGVFSTVEQFNKARYLILVPIRDLYKIVETTNSTQNKKILFLQHTDRCGSTLVTAMFKRLPDMQVFSVPESLYSAYYLYHVHKAVSLDQYKNMVRAAVSIHCLTPHKMVFFKLNSVACTSQMNMLYDLFPHSRTVFLSRNSEDVISSMKRIINTHSQSCRLLGWSRDSLVNDGVWATEKHNIPRDIAGILLHNWTACMEALDAAKMPVKAFTYEALVADPKEFAEEILRFFDIPDKHVGDMVKAMEMDSQKGTRVSRSNLKPIKSA